jgi:hypothetical protein
MVEGVFAKHTLTARFDGEQADARLELLDCAVADDAHVRFREAEGGRRLARRLLS